MPPLMAVAVVAVAAVLVGHKMVAALVVVAVAGEQGPLLGKYLLLALRKQLLLALAVLAARELIQPLLENRITVTVAVMVELLFLRT
jgi:hypothetical protein